MADQQAYIEVMKDAASAAWDNDWEQAKTAYRQAITLRPNDSQALAGLALSLMELQEYDDAIKIYEKVSQLVPSDPLPHEKMAEIYQQIGQPKEASKKLLAVAEIYLGRRDISEAVTNWEKAVQIDPEQAQAYIKLAPIYEKSKGTIPKAVYAYLALARILQQYNKRDRAEQFLQRALKLNPTDSEVRTALDNLRQGREIEKISTDVFDVGEKLVERKKAQTGQLVDPSLQDEDELWEETKEVTERTPADEAAHYAMGLLSDMVFNGDVPSSALTPLVQALELHQVGDAAGAIEMYSQALSAGVEHEALHFNLGLLYQYERRHPEAIDILEKAAQAPEYAVAAHQALGQIYLTEDEVRQASRHMVTALRAADLQVNQEIDEAGYDRLRASLSEQPLDQLTDLSKGISAYLSDVRWENKLQSLRQNYAEQGRTDYVSNLLEIVLEGGRPEMAQIMDRVDEYVEKGLLRLAMDETHYAIEKASDYLPAHRRMADIMVREGRNQSAADKINLVAEVYMIRGNAERAADLLAEVLTIWPTDMNARQRVIDMLKEQGRVNEALRHYAEMADQYYRIRFDQMKAVSIYNEAMTYARRNNAAPEQMVKILKALADIEAAQLNWNEALRYYDQCKMLTPHDEEVASQLIDLNFQLGNSAQAIAALDEYMRYCIENGQMDQIVSTLEKQVRMRGNEVALRQRLAEVYKQQGRIPEAIAQMDAIQEMLLEAGRIDDAKKIIQQLIALNPTDKEGYEQLLANL